MDELRRGVSLSAGGMVAADFDPFGIVSRLLAAAEPKESYPPLDERTEKMFKDLGKVSEKTVEPKSINYSFKEDGSFIAYGKSGEYSFSYYAWGSGKELLKIEKDQLDWNFEGDSLAVTPSQFSLWDGGQHTHFNPEGVEIFTHRFRDLFDVEINEQDWKGKDQNDFVDDLLRKTIAAKEIKIQWEHDLDMKATFGDSWTYGGFSFTMKFDADDHDLSLHINDGDKKLNYTREKDINGKVVSDVQLSSWSRFRTRNGVLSMYPEKPYTKTTAQALVNKVESAVNLLYAMVSSKRLTDYSTKVIDLTSQRNLTKTERGFGDFNYAVGSSKIQFDRYSVVDILEINEGDNRVRIRSSHDNGDVRSVTVNDHPFFKDKEGIHFISSTYTMDQAKAIFSSAQKFYDHVAQLAKKI